jgi:hypothetical protein
MLLASNHSKPVCFLQAKPVFSQVGYSRKPAQLSSAKRSLSLASKLKAAFLVNQV